MSEEIFDVVDEKDHVVGQLARSEVHRLGLLHRAVHIFVFNSTGQVFIQKRSLSKDRQPGLWDSSSSGHVDSGEDYDQSARRELREELGFDLGSTPTKLFKLGPCEETDCEHVWVYRCLWDATIEINRDEIERGEWLEPAELTQRITRCPTEFASALRFIWPKMNL